MECYSIDLGGTSSEPFTVYCVDDNITKFKFFIEAFCLRLGCFVCYIILYSALVPIRHFYELALYRGFTLKVLVKTRMFKTAS